MDNDTRNRIDIINQRIKEMNSLYRIAAVKSNISDGEVSVWSAILNTKEEYSQQDLCEILSLPKQTVNSIISGMRKKGFVYLEHVPGTRNRKVIRLTKEGTQYGNEKISWIFEAERTAMEETELEAIQVYIQMLEKYIQRFREQIEKR